jgi:hypothetical protein
MLYADFRILRSRIARYLCNVIFAASQRPVQRSTDTEVESLQRQIAAWKTTETVPADTSAASSESSDDDTGSEDERRSEDSRGDFSLSSSDIREFLLGSKEYDWLVHHIHRAFLSGTEDASLLRIRHFILNTLATSNTAYDGRYKRSLELWWQPRQFIHDQYDGCAPPLLGSVITISGSEGDAYADTCEGYVRMTWPLSGSRVLNLIERAVLSGEDSFQHHADDLSLEINFNDESTVVRMTGIPLMLTEAAEIAVWLSTACRTAASHETPQICRPVLADNPESSADVPVISTEVNFALSDLAPSSAAPGGTCWHRMFRNPVIVYGFPIPSRANGERGLEIPVELMLSLARTTWATIYCGVLILKGYATLLTPTLKIDKSVVWHLTADTRQRQSYNSGMAHSCLSNMEDALFPNARHFVGWLKSAEYLVGECVCPVMAVLHKLCPDCCGSAIMECSHGEPSVSSACARLEFPRANELSVTQVALTQTTIPSDTPNSTQQTQVLAQTQQ